MSAGTDCVFCAIVRGDLPSERVAEDERAIAFMDINPVTDGHLLVVPRTHSRDLVEVEEADLVAVTLMARRLAGRAQERLGADGVNLLNCCGESAWQTVFHFHLHVIPRFGGQQRRDALGAPWVPTPGSVQVIAEAAARLRD